MHLKCMFTYMYVYTYDPASSAMKLADHAGLCVHIHTCKHTFQMHAYLILHLLCIYTCTHISLQGGEDP